MMDLKSILEIRGMSEYTNPSISVYRAGLQAEYGWDIETLNTVMDAVRNQSFPPELPLSEFVCDYLTAYLMENDIQVNIVDPSKRVFTDDYEIVMYTKNNYTYTVFLDHVEAARLKDNLLAKDGGCILDPNLKTDILKNDPEFNVKKRILISMGIVEATEEDIENSMIPLSSPSLAVKENTSRFSSAIWFSKIQEKTIMLAGVGGIGSYCAYLLSRMQPAKIILYDDDRVETVNMAGQMFELDNIGSFKVDAAYTLCERFSNYHSILAINKKFEPDTPASDIMMCGFDSMTARKIYFLAWARHVYKKPKEERCHCLFIDGRLAAEALQVFCIRGDDSFNIKNYNEKYLFDSSQADETVCTYKQTTYMANMIGSIMVNLFTNFAANEVVENLRDLPFFCEYDASTMMLKTKD